MRPGKEIAFIWNHSNRSTNQEDSLLMDSKLNLKALITVSKNDSESHRYKSVIFLSRIPMTSFSYLSTDTK